MSDGDEKRIPLSGESLSTISEELNYHLKEQDKNFSEDIINIFPFFKKYMHKVSVDEFYQRLIYLNDTVESNSQTFKNYLIETNYQTSLSNLQKSIRHFLLIKEINLLTPNLREELKILALTHKKLTSSKFICMKPSIGIIGKLNNGVNGGSAKSYKMVVSIQKFNFLLAVPYYFEYLNSKMYQTNEDFIFRNFKSSNYGSYPLTPKFENINIPKIINTASMKFGINCNPISTIKPVKSGILPMKPQIIRNNNNNNNKNNKIFGNKVNKPKKKKRFLRKLKTNKLTLNNEHFF
ncbi:hypothetical protein PACTADRAFT_48645 [Pachysolen tannophilus NRRL Y-2460]|uniref:Uncharacterized protein n=1 Tax=Pachysolen tannophilus NRRL Y-2460 TaxID=669874 RepID=A0A1E4TYL1_PACTA|nr:hypothetical protein PACTADRAFT_48645 [Pachysolen tannophilus NRRL Y-2460]